MYKFNIFTRKLDLAGDATLDGRVTTLENNEYEITYFEQINTASGTITPPTGATILLDQFFGGIDAYVSEIENGQPNGEFPKTGLGVEVDVATFDALGNYTLDNTPASYPVALIYKIKIKAIDYSNVDKLYELDFEDTTIWEDGYPIYDLRYAQITAVTELAPVISQIPTASLPGSPTIGDRYLLTDGININKIAEWNGAIWVYTTPVTNNTVYVTNTLTTLRYNGASWVAYQGSAILQNGNSFGNKLFFGTNDNFDVGLKVNNNPNLFNFTTDGRVVLSTPAFGDINAGLWARGGTQYNVQLGAATSTLNAPTSAGTLNFRINNLLFLQVVGSATVNNRRTNILTPVGGLVFVSFHNTLEKIGIGMGTTTPTARVDIQGNTSDSTTDNLLLKDSATTELFRIRNDGAYKFKGGTLGLAQTGYTITNPSVQRTLNVTTGNLLDVKRVLGTLIDDLKTKGIIAS